MVPLTDGGADSESRIAESDSASELTPDTASDAVPEAASEAPSDSAASARLDQRLNLAIGAVALLLVALAAWFGYSYYAQVQSARLSSPALQVIDAVRKQVAENPKDPVLRSRLAEALGTAGKYDEARQELLTAVKLDPKYVGAYQNLAQIELLQKDYTNAEAHLKKVLELTMTGDYQNVNQRREEALFYLGEISIIKKRYEEAIGYLKAAVRIRKDASDSYLRLAQAYIGLGERDQALKQLNIALTFDPRFPEAHYERGKIYLAKGDKVNAAWDFRAALDVVPDAQEPKDALATLGTFDTWYKQAASDFEAGRIDAAADAVRIARAIDPQSYDAAMLHGRVLERQGDPSAAVAAYEVAARIEPDDKPAADAVKRATEASETKGAR